VKRFWVRLTSTLLLVVLLGLWEWGGSGSHPWLDPLFFSQPSGIFKNFLGYAESGLLLKDLTVTLEAAVIGLLLGMITGVAIGMLLGHVPALEHVLSPYMVGFNSLPRPALAPLLILWFGLGLASKVVLAWSLVFFVVLFNTLYGMRSIDRDYVRAIKVMGATGAQITRIVTLPSVFTWIFAAFRTSVSLALIGAVVGEFVGASAGLGYRTVIAAGLFQTDRVFVILIILMVVGASLVALAGKVESVLLRWRPPSIQL